MSRTDDMTRLRATLKSFCPNGADKEAVTVPQLAEALGLEPHEKQRLRKRIGELLRRGEVRKTKPGCYVHVPGKEPSRYGESYERIWRAVHVQRDPFTVRRIVQISRYAAITVSRFLAYLETDAFVEFAGYEGRARCFLLTRKGELFRDIPYPPTLFVDPTHPERIACINLHKLLLDDVDAPNVLRRIRKNLAILNARFAGEGEEPC